MTDMKGNPHYDQAEHLLRPAIYRTPGTYINAGPPDGAEIPPEPAQVYRALAQAQMATAFELRTLTLALAQNTPGWLDEVRGRLGHPTDPAPATPPTPEERDQRCNKRWMDGRNEVRCWGAKDHDGECT